MNVTEEKPLDILSEDTPVYLPSSITETVNSRQKSAKRFTIGIWVYTVFLVLSVIGILWYWGSALSHYESATPINKLQEYLTLVKEKDFETLYQNSGFEETALSTKSDYVTYLETLYSGSPLSVTARELLSSDPLKRSYAVCFDKKIVSTVTAVRQNNSWCFRTHLNYQPTYTLYAAADITVTVNGNELSLLNIPQTPVQQTLFNGSTDKSIYPTVIGYTLNGLLNPPNCTAYTLDGTVCTVTSFEDEPYVLYVSNPTTLTAMEELAKSAISDYACFIAGDIHRQTMLKRVYKNSELYEQITAYDNRGFQRHTEYELGDIQVMNALSFTDTDYSCTVSLSPTYRYKGETFGGDPLTCRLTFLNIEEEWLLISLEQIPDSSFSNTDTTIQTEEHP